MKTINGCLLDAYSEGKVNAIAHVANCQGVMGSGFALALKRQYPEAYHVYRKQFDHYGLDLGSISKTSGDRPIYNLHAQRHFGGARFKYISYDALYECLHAMLFSHPWVIGESKHILGIPYMMGSDRAGGDWRVVEAIVDSCLEGSEFTPVAYKL